MHRWNYKIYSYLARIGGMARARRNIHGVIKFTYRVPDTFASGHVEPGCRQHLEAICHWKRQVPDFDDQRAGRTRARRGEGKVAPGQVYVIWDYTTKIDR